MIINLTKSVALKEPCRISAIGHTINKAHSIEFTFSHEALVGFATELLWLYEDIDDNRKLNLCTYQLKVDPAPNQVLGFYLTPSSPMLVVRTNSLKEEEYGCEYKNWEEIYIEAKNINQYYDVKDPLNEDNGLIILEPYELCRKNIIDISIVDGGGEDITEYYSTVIFEINRKGIKDLASMLLVWANNSKEGDEYVLPHIDKSDCGYNLGIILTPNSIETKFKCGDLGTVHDYDSRI